MIRYEIRLPWAVPEHQFDELLTEFKQNGEFCNVLWRLYETPFEQWIDDIGFADQTYYGCFCIGETLVGVARITPHPNYIENGRFGFSIRPSFRGRGLAPVMLRMMEDFFQWTGVQDITACVDVNNEKSLNAFEKVGWKPTGRTYVWTNNRNAVELVPHAPQCHITDVCRKQQTIPPPAE